MQPERFWPERWEAGAKDGGGKGDENHQSTENHQRLSTTGGVSLGSNK